MACNCRGGPTCCYAQQFSNPNVPAIPSFPPPPAKRPHVCPVCRGQGAEVHVFLYMASITECPACEGTGVVWEP